LNLGLKSEYLKKTLNAESDEMKEILKKTFSVGSANWAVKQTL